MQNWCFVSCLSCCEDRLEGEKVPFVPCRCLGTYQPEQKVIMALFIYKIIRPSYLCSNPTIWK